MSNYTFINNILTTTIECYLRVFKSNVMNSFKDLMTSYLGIFQIEGVIEIEYLY